MVKYYVDFIVGGRTACWKRPDVRGTWIFPPASAVIGLCQSVYWIRSASYHPLKVAVLNKPVIQKRTVNYSTRLIDLNNKGPAQDQCEYILNPRYLIRVGTKESQDGDNSNLWTDKHPWVKGPCSHNHGHALSAAFCRKLKAQKFFKMPALGRRELHINEIKLVSTGKLNDAPDFNDVKKNYLQDKNLTGMFFGVPHRMYPDRFSTQPERRLVNYEMNDGVIDYDNYQSLAWEPK